MSELLMTADEAAEYLGLTVRVFRHHVQPCVPHLQTGSRRRFHRRDLDEWRIENYHSPEQDSTSRGASQDDNNKDGE